MPDPKSPPPPTRPPAWSSSGPPTSHSPHQAHWLNSSAGRKVQQCPAVWTAATAARMARPRGISAPVHGGPPTHPRSRSPPSPSAAAPPATAHQRTAYGRQSSPGGPSVGRPAPRELPLPAIAPAWKAASEHRPTSNYAGHHRDGGSMSDRRCLCLAARSHVSGTTDRWR
jgi:hypothetical protein